MGRDKMTNLQNARLRKLVDGVCHSTEYYRKKMQVVRLEPGDIREIKDLERLPLTAKDDSRDTYLSNMFAVPNSQITRTHASSGIMGKSMVVGYTHEDIDVWSERVARCITMTGLGSNGIIQMVYGYGLFTGGLETHYGAEEVEAIVVPMSTGNTKKLVTTMVGSGVTGTMCTPSYLLHIVETIEEMGVKDKIKLKASISGAEPWTKKMRTQIGRQLGIRAHDIYNLSEIIGPGVATDYQFHEGLHTHRDYFLSRTMDQNTLKPPRDGTTGEPIISTLTKEGSPSIRYRTENLTSLDHSTCQCGRTMARIVRFIGRIDNMLTIRSVNVFPSQIESALLEVGGTTPHYLLAVDRVNSLDTLEAQVEVEERSFPDETQELRSLTGKIVYMIQQVIGLAMRAKLVESENIEWSMGRAKHVIDKKDLN